VFLRHELCRPSKRKFGKDTEKELRGVEFRVAYRKLNEPGLTEVRRLVA